jgi:hypothetical protein
VELIGLLVKEGLLNVIYTTDGKDIITEQRLIREILDEIYANGGTARRGEHDEGVARSFRSDQYR